MTAARPLIRCPFERQRMREYLSRQLNALQHTPKHDSRALAAAQAKRELILEIWNPLVGDKSVRTIDAVLTAK